MSTGASYQQWTVLIAVGSLVITIISAGFRYKHLIAKQPGSHISEFKFWAEGIVTLLVLTWLVILSTVCDSFTIEISIIGIVLFWSFLKIKGTKIEAKKFEDSKWDRLKATLTLALSTVVSEPSHTGLILVIAPYSVQILSSCNPSW